MAAAQQIALVDPPKDGVSALAFAPNSDQLLVSSWDTGVRIYDVPTNTLRNHYTHKAPVLDCAWSRDGLTAFSGGLDRAVMQYDVAGQKQSVMGVHDDAVKAVAVSASTGLLFSGSWDKSVKLWDHRSSDVHVQTLKVPERVYSMDMTDTRLVVATAGLHVAIFDLRRLEEPEQIRMSSLKHQTRCVRCFPDGSGYALSTIEGRVSLEYFDLDPTVQERKFAFKCHRVKQAGGAEDVHPVNCLAFHRQHGTFATGGCDKRVNIWDGQNRKRIANIGGFPTSIAALDFNRDGTLLAVASSYTYEEGEKDHPPDSVLIRTMEPSEVLPKNKK